MKKIGGRGILLACIALILLAGVGVYAMGSKDKAVAEPVPATAATTPGNAAPVEMTFENASLPKDPLGARTLGDPSAPVKMEEFASLTCGHCAHFEAVTFPELKKKYIDTGKVFYTFTDFPLNAPALDAAMIARCLPPERYFPFLVMLFANQEQWAFTPDYKTSLRQNAKLAGLSDEKFDACLADKALKDGIVKSMQDRGQQFGVESTPTFILGEKRLTGALPIDAFDKAIEETLANPPAPANKAAVKKDNEKSK